MTMIETIRRRLRKARLPPDHGAATAEFAVVLPCVVVMAALLLSLTQAVVTSMDCRDAAAVAVREMVAGGDESQAERAAVQVAGSDSSIAIVRRERYVEVTVTCPVMPGPMNLLPVRVTGEATGVLP
ncbi:pilus assembly protein TadE [Bifidobacterium lemurum]|uniref:Pilus assembly protein TadE n=2 Tax=Bifidobacterium lemurum TaxID=1603886 RepID=A0A261FSA1_9BIFI|nr:TadE family protein [Bifidobacterium lemurum]OZG62070.1 pilus assembly protein TadE [Bifidobacterium lemurum]QOL34899.1 pilus assembly protein [Bifidobacterium lemurum]